MTTTTVPAQDVPVKQSLFEMAKELGHDQSDRPDKQEATTEPAEDAVEPVDPVEPEPEEEPSEVTEPVGTEQGSSDGSTEASVAHQFLTLLGYDVDGVSEEDLIAEAKRRFEQVHKPEPVRQPKPNIEPKVDIVSATPEAGAKEETKPETAKQAESQRIAKLYCDPKLEALVEYNKAGKAIAREDTGDDGVVAAKQINEYMKSYRERMQRFGEDPIGFLEEGGLQDLIQREAQAVIDRMEAQRKQQAEQVAREQSLTVEEQSVQAFFTEHSQEIYAHGKDGKPRFTGDDRQLSEFGLALEAEYEGLRKKYPNAPDSTVLADAYERVKKVATVPVAPAAETKPVKEVAAEKKKRFLDKRTAPPRQETTASPPTISEQSGKVSLRDLVLADSLNDDNPAVLKLRGSAR